MVALHTCHEGIGPGAS